MADSIERAGMLLDVVQKVASVAPAYTAISSMAMAELKEMNEDSQRQLNELGRRRLEAEQEAAAELDRKNQEAMEEQTRTSAEIAERTAASNAIKPIQVMPGEPNPMVDINKRQGLTPEGEPSTNPADDSTPHEPHGVARDHYTQPDDNTPVARRV